MNFQMFLRSALGLLGTLVIIGINTTYVLVPFIPLLAIFACIQNYFGGTSVQLKRLEAVSRSPVYAHFSESLGGMATIRAFLAQGRMVAENSLKLDENQRIYVMVMTANRWLSIRLEFLGALLILATAVNCVILRNSLSASSAGIALAYALQITSQLNLLVRMCTEVESSFNAVERVQVRSEAVVHISLRYSSDSPCVFVCAFVSGVLLYRA
jgi:ABC-type multidrug transport system fused ATPase/permease subunit